MTLLDLRLPLGALLFSSIAACTSGKAPLRDSGAAARNVVQAQAVHGQSAASGSGELPPRDPPPTVEFAGAARADGWALAAAEWGLPALTKGFPQAETLSAAEWERIGQGWTVARPMAFDRAGRHYVGGVAFQVVRAQSADILATFSELDQLRAALPLTRDAELLERTPSAWAVELLSGTSAARARYTIRFARHSEQALRFSLDHARAHDIADAIGYLTATPFSETHSLVTLAVGIDLGSGIKRALFSKPVQRAALAAPAHLRRYLELPEQLLELARSETDSKAAF